MACVRCGGVSRIERHHIIERFNDGGDEPENLEDRCYACHKYEHARRALVFAIVRRDTVDVRNRGLAVFRPQRQWLLCFRLAVLDALNPVGVARETGNYTPYWTVKTTRNTPKKVPD